MSQAWLPILFTLFAWWFSTGAILYLDGLPRRTYPWTMGVATMVLAAALWGLADAADETTIGAAYLAFACALAVWGWHEMSFLMGVVTGPRRTPCPEGCRGWRRFGLAVQTCIYHDLAIAVTAAAIVAGSWGEPNQVGTWTFLVLWGMRLSAKLNVHLGVRNLSEDWLPEHLGHLKSFLTRKPMNLLFPVSVTAATWLLAVLVERAGDADATAFEATGAVFLATLVALGLLEHWFLVLPLPFAALWNWGLRSRGGAATVATPPIPAPASAQWR